MAVAAVLLMLCVAFSPIMASDHSEASTAKTATATAAPGTTWTWTPTFNITVDSVKIAGSTSEMPTDATATSLSNPTASVGSGNKITVQFPTNFSATHYYLLVKATSSKPTQTATYAITFNITYGLTATGSTTQYLVQNGNAMGPITLTPTGGSAVKSVSVYNSANTTSATLPAGISATVNTAKTAVTISGKATAMSNQTEYTIRVALENNTTLAQKISLGVYTKLEAKTGSDYAVYNSADTSKSTAVSVDGYTWNGNAALTAGSVSVTKNEQPLAAASGKYDGMTVDTRTGAVSGTPTAAGTYIFTTTVKSTAETGDQSSTYTVTVQVDNPAAITGEGSKYSYVGHSDDLQLSESNLSSEQWKITKITKGGNEITAASDATDYNSFSVGSTTGKVTSSAATTEGTYVVTVKVYQKDEESVNSATKNVTFTVKPKITLSPESSEYYRTTDGSAADKITLTSNMDGTKFTVSSNSLIQVTTPGKTSTVSTTTTTAQASSTATKVTVTATDPNNASNTATATINVYVTAVLDFTNEPTAEASTS